MSKDNVNHPSHYTFGKIEVIDYIRDKMPTSQFCGYCMGNVLKYVSRHKHKGGLEDLKKARVYLDWMIEAMEKDINDIQADTTLFMDDKVISKFDGIDYATMEDE